VRSSTDEREQLLLVPFVDLARRHRLQRAAGLVLLREHEEQSS